MNRLLFAAGIATTLFALLAPPAQAAPPCNSPEALSQSEYSPLTVIPPRLLTFDRLATVLVHHTGLASIKVLSARLDYVDANGSVFFTNVLGAEHLDPGPEGATLKFPIQLGADRGQVVVRLTVTQQRSFASGSPYPACEVVKQGTVRPFPGRTPRFQLLIDDYLYFEQRARLTLGIDRVCERIAPGEARVVVSHHGRMRGLVLRLHRPCGYQDGLNFGWHRSGPVIPGLRFGRGAESGLGISAIGRRRWTRVYRLDAFWNDRRMLRRWVRASHRYKPARRIYEDSDNFEEACGETSGEDGPPIHEDKRGAYCVEPAQHQARFRVLRERPKPRSG